MAGEIYSADEVIGKTLYGVTAVPIKRNSLDASPVVYTVPQGQAIGTVYSYLLPKAGRTNLHWMFYDQNNRPYYAEHIQGRFNTTDLQTQGALTVKEQIEAEQKKNETTKDFIERVLKYAGIGLLAYLGFKTVINKTSK